MLAYMGSCCKMTSIMFVVFFSLSLNFIFQIMLVTWIVNERDFPNWYYWIACFVTIILLYLLMTFKFNLLFVRGFIAGTKIHRKMIHSVCFSPQVFFDKNPSGRILNRFSNDIGMIDTQLMFGLGHLINGSIEIFYIFIMAIVMHWANFFLGIFLFFIMYTLSNYIQHPLMKVKILDNVQKSPIYNKNMARVYQYIDIINILRF